MCEFERQNADVSYLELFKPSMINRTHVGVFTQIWSQLTGMNSMMYYILYIFAMAGLEGDNLLVSSSIQYVINVCMTVPALLWVDRWGRRPTLILGAMGMLTFMFVNAGLMATYGHAAPPGGLGHIEAQSWVIKGPASKAVIASTYLFVAYVSLITPLRSNPLKRNKTKKKLTPTAPTPSPGAPSAGSTRPSCSPSASAAKPTPSAPPPTGPSTLRSATSSLPPSPTSPGKSTSSSASSAQPCVCTCSSCSPRQPARPSKTSKPSLPTRRAFRSLDARRGRPRMSSGVARRGSRLGLLMRRRLRMRTPLLCSMMRLRRFDLFLFFFYFLF